uniref:RNase H type-1 domain-containing protein n=1 Tax=Hordeum vulgare subsp. vulgare TaxID=112509 RepID=A0A8I7B5T3_HORVV
MSDLPSCKINCDGAFPAPEGTSGGGWGFVIQHLPGDVRGSGTGRLRHVASALQAEARACSAALQAAS